LALLARLRPALLATPSGVLVESPEPDGPLPGAMAGGWQGWSDLAAGLTARLSTPERLEDGWVRIGLRPLGSEDAWQRAPAGPDRYADAAGFGALRKLEHPGLALPLLAALARVRPPDGGRVLLLGCGQGEELVALRALQPPPANLEVVGLDHAAPPLARAAARFPQATWLEGDVNELPEDLGAFDLVVAVALLQSPAVDAGRLVRRVVQRHLRPRGGLLFGWPNGRFRDGVPVWGARTRNRSEGDLALVVKDLAGHRRYLHQHRFATHVGGGYELFLTAWR
jgi:SAM-dependent methyltransferase